MYQPALTRNHQVACQAFIGQGGLPSCLSFRGERAAARGGGAPPGKMR